MKNLLVIERNPIELERARKSFEPIKDIRFLTSNIFNKKQLHGLGDIQLEPEIHNVPVHGIMTDVYFNSTISKVIERIKIQDHPQFIENLLRTPEGKILFQEMGMRNIFNSYKFGTPLVVCLSGLQNEKQFKWMDQLCRVSGHVLVASDNFENVDPKPWGRLLEWIRLLWAQQTPSPELN